MAVNYPKTQAVMVFFAFPLCVCPGFESFACSSLIGGMLFGVGGLLLLLLHTSIRWIEGQLFLHDSRDCPETAVSLLHQKRLGSGSEPTNKR